MGKTPSRNNPEYWENGTNPWISISDMTSNGKYIVETKECITDKAVHETGIKAIFHGTVIMSFKLSVGKVAIVQTEGNKAYSNEAIMAFEVKDDLPDNILIRNDYVYYLLSSLNFDNTGNKAVMGKTLNRGIISNTEVSLHNFEEQSEIANILDKVSELIELRKKQLEKLDELVKARFVELFGNLKANPKGWPIMPFPEFAEIDCNMTTDYEKYADYPHIGIDSIEKGTGELKGYRTVREDGVISGKYIFTPQHIIYSKIRPNLNKVALPDFEGLCSADAYPILPNHENCNRVFLAVAMRSEYYLEYILQFSSRTNLPKVNRKEIAGFRMPLPPLALQEQFAAFVEQTDKSKVVVQKALDEAQTLFDSLMQEYFG